MSIEWIGIPKALFGTGAWGTHPLVWLSESSAGEPRPRQWLLMCARRAGVNAHQGALRQGRRWLRHGRLALTDPAEGVAGYLLMTSPVTPGGCPCGDVHGGGTPRDGNDRPASATLQNYPGKFPRGFLSPSKLQCTLPFWTPFQRSPFLPSESMSSWAVSERGRQPSGGSYHDLQ
jgi:hypothetical protein